ncbi:MAG: cyclic nucleotide-binding and patatin-like phospholipase domain-containing protein [Ardenticatenia bacterium]|nr:cyclic nucleotide-binding and patatin-like phospholipase domain-containing protein [Ardenticatenia bacterium]
MHQNLRRIPFFQGLSDDVLQAIQSRMKLRRYKKGDVVFVEGAPADSMYIIESGQVQIVAEGKGDQPGTVLAHLGPGFFFGEMALLTGDRRSATVRVVIDAELWELHKNDLDELLREHPHIALTISRELSRRLSRTIHQLTEVDEINLIAVVGEQVPLFIERLKAATGDRLLVVDLGGLRPEHPDLPEGVDVVVELAEGTPEDLAEYLGDHVNEYGRIVMVITPHETPLTRKAAELAEVVVEIGKRSTPWLKRFGRENYWFTPGDWRRVDRVARRIARKLVGLALSAGNARGLAHIGVLRVLEEANVPVDVIAGTSMGALIGSLYAVGHSIKTLEEFASQLPKLTSFFSGLWDLQVPPRSGIIKGEKARRYLAERWFAHKAFEDLDTPLYVVAADVVTGEEVVFESGPIADAVRASISIMGVFQPAHVNGRYLIDGGTVNPVPVSVVSGKANIVVASSVIVSLADRAHRKALMKSGRLPSILGIVLGAQEIMEAGIVESRMGHVDVLIQPDVADLGGMEYDRWEVFVQRGYKAAQRYVEDIQRLLSAPRGRRAPLSVLRELESQSA